MFLASRVAAAVAVVLGSVSLACTPVPRPIVEELRRGSHLEILPNGRDLTDAASTGVLRRLAADLVQCDPASVVLQAREGIYTPSASGTVEGCGRSAAWLVTSVGYRDSSTVPGYVGTKVFVAMFQMFVISRDGEPAPTDGAFDVERYAALDAQGAKDLGCARERVLAWYARNAPNSFTPVAEGCGQRVTYVPTPANGAQNALVLVSRVPIAPPP